MTELSRARWRGLWVAAGLLALAGCVFVVGVVLRVKDLQTAANVAQLVSVVLAVPALARPLMSWWRCAATPVVVGSESMAQAKDVLTMLMTQQWRRESHLRALDDPDPIPVQWRLTVRDEVIDLIDNRTPGVLTLASSADVIAMVNDFRRLKRQR